MDSLRQTIAIPAECTSATLRFALRIDSTETTTTTAFDRLRVSIGRTLLIARSNLDYGEYREISADLTSYVGQQVTITFSGTEDSSLATTFLIDDVAVAVGVTHVD